MEVVSASPLRVGSIVWQPRPGAFVLTVVCKATFALAPFESLLAPEQDDPHEADGHWNDDDSRSLSIATDLSPFKRNADVFLTGSAFAPSGTKVRNLTARLSVHGVNKTIDIASDRVWTRDGELLEGAPFAKMPLRWERAAGGPETANPVGVRTGPHAEPDARGVYPAPNLLPHGTRLGRPTDLVAPAGFAPIAPSWPERAAKLNRHQRTWDHRAYSALPLPDDIDAGYFNAAPADQQVASLPHDPRIVLERLHPAHPVLVTSLARVDPRAVVERARGKGELALRSDTLWIDTDRLICTLTWRGQLPLEHANEPGRVVVSAVLSQPWGAVSGAGGADGPAEGTGTLTAPVAVAAILPFQGAPGSPAPAVASPAPPFAAIQSAPFAAAPPPLVASQPAFAAAPPAASQPAFAAALPGASQPAFAAAPPGPFPAAPPAPFAASPPGPPPLSPRGAPPPPPAGAGPGIAGLSVTMPIMEPPQERLPFRPGTSPLAAPDSARLPSLPAPETGTLGGASSQRISLPYGAGAFSATLHDLEPPAQTPPRPSPAGPPPPPPSPAMAPPAPAMAPPAPAMAPPVPALAPPILAPPRAEPPPPPVPRVALRAQEAPAAPPMALPTAPPAGLPGTPVAAVPSMSVAAVPSIPVAAVPSVPVAIGAGVSPIASAVTASPAETGSAAPPAAPAKVSSSGEPDPGHFTVDRCAAIAASLARRRAEQGAILEQAGLTLPVWTKLFKHWDSAIRRESDAGKTELLSRFDAAYVGRLEQERGPVSVAQYAELVVANERGDLDAALSRLSLPPGCFLRIERVWLDRTDEDPALAASVSAAIDTLRDD